MCLVGCHCLDANGLFLRKNPEDLFAKQKVDERRHVGNGHRAIIVDIGSEMVVLLGLDVVLSEDDVHQCHHVGNGDRAVAVDITRQVGFAFEADNGLGFAA